MKDAFQQYAPFVIVAMMGYYTARSNQEGITRSKLADTVIFGVLGIVGIGVINLLESLFS